MTRMSRSLPLAAVLAFVTGACSSGGGSATVRITSAPSATPVVDETLEFGTTAANGSDLKVSPSSGAVIDFPYNSDQTSAIVGAAPTMNIHIAARMISTASGPMEEPEPWGVGPFRATMYFVPAGEISVTTVNHNFWIDEWRFTGDADYPFHISARSLTTGAPTGPWLAYDVTFEATTDCTSSIGASSQATCGGSPPPKDIVGTMGSDRGFTKCPTEIVKVFTGSGEGAAVTWADEVVSVDGADLELPCVQTREGKEDVVCGADEDGIEIGDCTWHAYAWAVPSNNAGKPFIQTWIGAVTDSDCATRSACNSSFRSF